jgi:hypothetical protein
MPDLNFELCGGGAYLYNTELIKRGSTETRYRTCEALFQWQFDDYPVPRLNSYKSHYRCSFASKRISMRQQFNSAPNYTPAA